MTDTAEDKLETMATEHAAKHNVSHAVAYAAVLKTAEGSALYTKSLEEPRLPAAQRKTEIEKGLAGLSEEVDELYSQIAKQIRRPDESEAAAYVRAMDLRPDLYNRVETTRSALGL